MAGAVFVEEEAAGAWVTMIYKVGARGPLCVAAGPEASSGRGTEGGGRGCVGTAAG